MNLVSLLILPAVISLTDDDAARLAIAGVALAVILGGVVFSKRSGATIGGDAA
jgi:K(+)-stimulated pyrophosphate-energized sodium pump